MALTFKRKTNGIVTQMRIATASVQNMWNLTQRSDLMCTAGHTKKAQAINNFPISNEGDQIRLSCRKTSLLCYFLRLNGWNSFTFGKQKTEFKQDGQVSSTVTSPLQVFKMGSTCTRINKLYDLYGYKVTFG